MTQSGVRRTLDSTRRTNRPGVANDYNFATCAIPSVYMCGAGYYWHVEIDEVWFKPLFTNTDKISNSTQTWVSTCNGLGSQPAGYIADSPACLPPLSLPICANTGPTICWIPCQAIGSLVQSVSLSSCNRGRNWWSLLLSLTHGGEPFWRSRQLCSYSRASKDFMQPEGSLPCSQELSTGPYPESYQSNPYHPILSL
jgi:hypothetical protein